MNVNFFQWLRDSVRHSVLMGVSDAVEQIGIPENSDEKASPALAAILGEAPATKSKRGGGRKRLGKSLKEMELPE